MKKIAIDFEKRSCLKSGTGFNANRPFLYVAIERRHCLIIRPAIKSWLPQKIGEGKIDFSRISNPAKSFRKDTLDWSQMRVNKERLE
jgi:hypothetical protein